MEFFCSIPTALLLSLLLFLLSFIFYFYLQCVPFSIVRWSSFARVVYARDSHPQQLEQYWPKKEKAQMNASGSGIHHPSVVIPVLRQHTLSCYSLCLDRTMSMAGCLLLSFTVANSVYDFAHIPSSARLET
jgi:hypothetical protein